MRQRDDCAEAPAEVDPLEEHHDHEPEHLDHPAFRTQLVRVGVAVVDAVILLGMNGALLLVIALSTGLPPSSLLRQSAALSALCAVPTVLYFVLFNGIAGRTLGGWVCRMPEPRPHPPLTLDAILRRSLALGSSLDATERDPSGGPRLRWAADRPELNSRLARDYCGPSAAGIPIRRRHSA